MNNVLKAAANYLEEYYENTGDLDMVPAEFREFIDWQAMARHHIMTSEKLTVKTDGSFRFAADEDEGSHYAFCRQSV